jgi:hypothetical protein
MALALTSYDAAYQPLSAPPAPAPSNGDLAKLKAKIHSAPSKAPTMGDFTPPPRPALQSAEASVPEPPVSSAGEPDVGLAQQSYLGDGAIARQQAPRPTQAAVLDRLNYAIQLLEAQHDRRTDTVPEELCLYTFFGVFVIYVLDSFTRVARYRR